MIAGEASITAKICAFARAHYSRYENNPICSDPMANELLGTKDYEDVKKRIVQMLSDKCWNIPTMDTWDYFLNEFISPIIISRMKYAEDQLKELIEDEKEQVQYVICGAGLDSFIFRNRNKNLKIFELDHPDTQQYKIKRIKELGWSIPDNSTFVSIDFEYQHLNEVLLRAGFQPYKKTLYVILGVTYYLALDTFEETIHEIAQLSYGSKSQIIFDYPDKDIVKRGRLNPRMEALQDITESLGEKMKGGMNYKELSQVANRYGFYISEHVTSPIIQERYFESSQTGMQAFDNISFMKLEN